MKHVLIVDDTEQNRVLLESLRRNAGVESHQAPDGAGALAALEQRLNRLEHAAGKEERRHSLEPFEMLFRSSPLASVLYAAENGRLLRVNARFLELMQFENEEEAIGRTGEELGIWCDLKMRDRMRDVLDTEKQILAFEARMQGRQGRQLDVLLAARKVESPDGPVVMVQGLDITERANAEAAMREKDRLLQRLMDLVPHFIFAKDSRSRFLYVNEAAAAVTGMRPEQVVGLSDLDLPRDPAEAEAFMRDDQEVISSGRPKFVPEERLTDARGRVRIHQTHKIPFMTPVTGESAVLGVAEDITERKRAETALRESEARLQAIVHQTPNVAVQGYDIHGHVRLWNEASTKMFGWSAGEAMGRTLDQLIHTPEETEVFLRILRDLAGTGKSVGPSEYHFKRRDGEEAWCISTIFEIPGFSGEPMFVCMDVDITERKRAETRMAAFAELGRKLGAAETAREAGEIIAETADQLLGWDACVLDLKTTLDGMIQSVVRKDTIDGVRLDVAGRPDDRSVTPRMRRVFEHGAELDLRKEPVVMPADSIPIGDGSRPSRSLMTVPIRDRSRPIGILSIQSYKLNAYTPADLDILQSLADHCSGALNRVRAEEEAMQLADFPKLNPDPVMELTSRAEVGYFNESAARLAHELGFAHPSELLPAEAPAIVRECLASGLSRQRLEAACGNRLVSWAFHPIPARGVVHCCAGDVTEHRRLEAQLRQAQKMEAIGTLAGGIAHDFNNILGAILGNVELAIMDVDSSHPLAENLTEIRNASTRARDLVRQILSFSRREAEAQVVVNLRKAIEDDMRLLRATLPTTVALEFHSSPRVPDVVADPTRIHQVLINLCTNAWHAMEDRPGKISLSLEPIVVDPEMAGLVAGLASGLHARLTVKDNGKGMDSVVLERAFEPFFTTKDTGKGTGLGLSVVHGIIKSLRGAVHVTSQPGLGTTVEVYFPAAQEGEGPADAASHDQPSTPRGQGQRILCLDDENSMLKVMTRLLQRQGYKPEGFDTVAGALAALQAGPDYDLIVTDHNMPGAGGLEVAREARTIQPGLPVILVSGFINDKFREEAKAANVGKLLLKPFEASELLDAVYHLAARRSPGQEPV